MKQMKRLYAILLPVGILAAMLFMNGCSKAPINSTIEGLWRLEYFITKEDNARHDCERLFYGITRYVVEVSEKQGTHGYGSFIGRFEYRNDETQVVMKEFKQRYSTGDNGIDATPEQLMPFGLNATHTVFDVVEAKGKKLVLESNYATLTFSKF